MAGNGIDVEIPPAPQPDLDMSLPETPGIPPSPDSDYSPQEVAEHIGEIESIFFPDASRVALNIFAANGNLVTAIEGKSSEFMEKGAEDPAAMALGLDLKMEALVIQEHDIDNKIKAAKGKRIEELQQKKNNIHTEWIKTNELRRNISIENPDLSLNELWDFGKAFGIPEELITGRETLLVVREFITSALQNKDIANTLLKRVRENGMPGELVSQLEEYLNRGVPKSQAETHGKRGRRIAMAGATLGLMTLLAAWLQIKMDSGKRQ